MATATPNELCATCRLRRKALFRPAPPEEVAFVQKAKAGEQVVPAGGTIVAEGETSASIFTLLSGWAFRHRTLPDGRRQILNFLLPGDLLGLQARLFEQSPHGIEALTESVLCVFPRTHVFKLSQGYPRLVYDMVWLASSEERIVDETLLTVGRRNAIERVAWLVAHLWMRGEALGLARDGALPLPATQAHIADALGLSLVHVNRTLQVLRRRRLFTLANGVLRDVDIQGIERLTGPAFDRIEQVPLL